MLKQAVTFMTTEQQLDNLKINTSIDRGNLISVESADWHFGAFDPKLQYEILEEQLFKKIETINFDVFFILGDIFNTKSLANSNAVMYASLAMNRAAQICKSKKSTLCVITGTESHDAGQLKLFYSYFNDKDLDFRLVEELKFEIIKGAKVLCIPEEYGKGSDYYNKFFFQSGYYDLAVVHGMIRGAVFGTNVPTKDTEKAPIFCIEDFCMCRGCILSGHIHVSGCYFKYFYYTGSPYRWSFGEEQEKGFMITLMNLNTGQHFTHFEKIESYKYITVNLDKLIDDSPENIVALLKEMKDKENIHYIRLEMLNAPNQEQLATIEILKNYFKTNNNVVIKYDRNSAQKEILRKNNEVLEKYTEFSYITDKSLTPEQILVRYINQKLGYEYISVEELKEFLTDDI